MKTNHLLTAWALAALAACPALTAQEARPIGKYTHVARHTEKWQPATAALRTDFLRQAGGLQAAFSCRAEAGEETVWSDNFDEGTAGWTFDNPKDFSWTTKQTGNETNPAKRFASIDPDDVQSLYIEGHYRYANRGTATATGPLVTIPRNGQLKGYVGFSLNFSESCTLTLWVCEGDNRTKVWSSATETGEKPWIWRPVTADLSAFAEKEVRLQFVYGCDTDWENWGYSGDFAIDGLKITSAGIVDNVSVATGETVKLTDLSTGNPTAWNWSFPGGTPATSTEQSPEVYYTQDGTYDISLTVSRGEESHSVTRSGFVIVKGQAPVAAILPPATFRYSTTRLPMVAPLAKVQYQDASANYPASWQWTFTGVDPDPTVLATSTEANPAVSYNYRHQQEVLLEVSNQHGTSSAQASVSVEYDGFITNLQPDDALFTFGLDGYGEFPGTNKMDMTEFAEKFSKPSSPIFVYGATVYFTHASAKSIVDQIADISVDLYTSENGVPGKAVDGMSWRVFELEQSSGSSLVGTDFEFTNPAVIDDEFFFVVRGMPEKNDSVQVAFATARFRDQGNTAYFKQRGEWKSAADYFPAGENHTSYAIFPLIAHSVMAPMVETPLTAGRNAGSVKLPFFSIFGYETPVACNADWCEVTSTPNGLTLDTLVISYGQLPAGMSERTATLTLTDGASTVNVELVQRGEGISAVPQVAEASIGVYPAVFNDRFTVMTPRHARLINVFDQAGRLVYKQALPPGTAQCTVHASGWKSGIYLIQAETDGKAQVVKAVKP